MKEEHGRITLRVVESSGARENATPAATSSRSAPIVAKRGGNTNVKAVGAKATIYKR